VPWSARFDHGERMPHDWRERALIAAGTEHLKPGSRNWGIPAGWEWISSPKRALLGVGKIGAGAKGEAHSGPSLLYGPCSMFEVAK
jgi:hypothetical protein